MPSRNSSDSIIPHAASWRGQRGVKLEDFTLHFHFAPAIDIGFADRAERPVCRDRPGAASASGQSLVTSAPEMRQTERHRLQQYQALRFGFEAKRKPRPYSSRRAIQVWICVWIGIDMPLMRGKYALETIRIRTADSALGKVRGMAWR